MSPNRVKTSGPGETSRLESIAQEIFRLHFLFWSFRRRSRTDDPYELTEPEFVALDTLARREVCTVGELQQTLDVRPAQMSRMIRALESKGEKPFITCVINTQDKRRINVTLTELGLKARDEYRARRLVANMELLKDLSDSESAELQRLLHRFRQILSEHLNQPGA